MKEYKDKNHPQLGEKNSQFGTKCIYNEELRKTTHVKESDVESYLNNGWKLGAVYKWDSFFKKKELKVVNENKRNKREANIEDWFIDSCKKIKYMFPKAHAAAYVISAFRIAWFKVHHPIWYYAAYFSIRCDDFDIETMIKGYDAIDKRIIDLENKGREMSNKEENILDSLRIALEATARGVKFAKIDLNKSDAHKFKIDKDGSLIPPFSTIDGLGDTVSNLLVEEREKKPFLSIEDMQIRAKVSQTLVDKLRDMHILDGLPESNQLSLF